MYVATGAWHYDYVDREKAMTELLRPLPRRRMKRACSGPSWGPAAALHEADRPALKQKDLVAETGNSPARRCRGHIEDEKIRRGEIPRHPALPCRAGTRRQAPRRPRVLTSPGRAEAVLGLPGRP